MGRRFSKQKDSIRQSTARLNIWHGSVRSGKTIASIYRWINFCEYGPKYGNLAMIGKTERTLQRNIIDPLKIILGNSCNYNQGKGELYIGSRKIYIFGANDKRAEEKIRGGTWAGCYGDEITLWPAEVFKMSLSRMSVDGAKFFGTTNTDSPYHWLKIDYIDRKDGLDLESFPFELEDNVRPEGFLSKDFVDNLKKEYVGLWYKRFILGLWVLAEGSVYDMWDEKEHTGDFKNKSFQDYVIGIDYGTSNPCTFGLYGYSGKSMYLLDEYYYDSSKSGRQKTDSEYASDFKVWLDSTGIKQERLRRVYIDPSAASFRVEMKAAIKMRKNGWSIRDANNDVLDGIRLVASKLNRGEFFVDKGCKDTIKEFNSYVWDPNAQKKGEDVPLKEHDHAMDRNRYVLYSLLGNKKKQSKVWGNVDVLG